MGKNLYKMRLENYLINQKESILNALKKIELNHNGIIIAHDDDKKVTGIATDGDIRRKLLDEPNMNDPISKCLNKNFISSNENIPREFLLKQLDHNIKMIPVLDSQKKLISIVTRDYFPEVQQKKIFARAKAPVRVSFGGGGSDTSAFFYKNNGAVINSTITLYSHVTLKVRDDKKIQLHSLDLNKSIKFNNLKELLQHDGRFSLIRCAVMAIKPDFGFELFIHSDYPMSSGLGGSATVTAAILGCFNQFRTDKWDQYEIAEIAFQAERLHLGVSGGWQDQYATVFGGLNFIEFNKDQNIINPIRLSEDVLLELEESLILCYTGLTHDSGNIHNDQKKQTKKDDIKDRINSNVELTYEMRDNLLKGRLTDFGKNLHKAWMNKRSFSNKISNPALDEIYDGAIKNGAIGGKLLGAGGGGYFLFYVPPFSVHTLLKWLKNKNLYNTTFKFESKGLQSWTVREKK